MLPKSSMQDVMMLAAMKCLLKFSRSRKAGTENIHLGRQSLACHMTSTITTVWTKVEATKAQTPQPPSASPRPTRPPTR